MILGHEFSGEIVAAPPDLQGRIGERVGILAYRGCGRCLYCRRGQHNLCADTAHLGHGAGWGDMEYNPGGMAELCPVWSEMAYPLPPSISHDEALLLDGAGVAVHAVARAQVTQGDWVVALGCGPIGLLALQIARVRGARVIASDIVASALELAGDLGAEVSVLADPESLAEAVADATHGDGAAAVLNSVGTPDSVAEGMKLLQRSGLQILLALEPGELRLPLTALAGERVLTVSANNTYPEFEEALLMVRSEQIQGRQLITHHFPLAQAAEAFSVAERRAETGAVKVVLHP
jgi:threonine dehydrogenase-like Zn-dependent dehydrogenase